MEGAKKKSSFRKAISIFKKKQQLTQKTLSVLVLGCEGTGKSSLINVLCDEEFSDAYSPTAFDIYNKEIDVNKTTQIKLTIFDISDKCKFNSMRRQYIDEADVFLLVYSKDRPGSFKKVVLYKKEISNVKNELISDLSVAVIRNKCDSLKDISENNYDDKQALKWCNSVFHCSAKFGLNISMLKNYLVEESLTSVVDKQMNKGVSGRYIFGGSEKNSRSVSLIQPKTYLGAEFDDEI